MALEIDIGESLCASGNQKASMVTMTMAEMLSRFLKDQVEVLGRTYLPE